MANPRPGPLAADGEGGRVVAAASLDRVRGVLRLRLVRGVRGRRRDASSVGDRYRTPRV